MEVLHVEGVYVNKGTHINPQQLKNTFTHTLGSFNSPFYSGPSCVKRKNNINVIKKNISHSNSSHHNLAQPSLSGLPPIILPSSSLLINTMVALYRLLSLS